MHLYTKKEIALRLKIRTTQIRVRIPDILERLKISVQEYRRIKVFNLEQSRILHEIIENER
jgi:hypothetical protein